MLTLPDHWVWDFWTAHDGERHHLFFLKAARSLGDPDLRHWNVRIGHAVSTDLVDWEVLDDAFGPAEGGLDDYTTWTGSIVRDGDLWWMFYTGTSIAERGLVQRIFAATSPDLHTWTRVGQPVVEADARWYETPTDYDWFDVACRDPWVLRDPDGDGWHMLFTARRHEGPADERGVIGHAVSEDLRSWEVRAPLPTSGPGFGQLEVAHPVADEGAHAMVFSCRTPELSAQRRAAGQVGGVWIAPASGPLGPVALDRAALLLPPDLYAGKVVRTAEGSLVALGFRYEDGAGGFAGVIEDPVPLGSLAGWETTADPLGASLSLP